MIGKLTGKFIEADEKVALIETQNGISFEIHIPPSTVSHFSKNSVISLYTYLQVKDDALVLFGFETKREKDIFKLLISVPSVGPKTAFLIISFTKVDDIIEAIKKNTVDFFTKIPGLGKKTAYKIILELSQKVNSDFTLAHMNLSDDEKTAIQALISLGFSTQDAKKRILELPKNLSLEQKIKESLKK